MKTYEETNFFEKIFSSLIDLLIVSIIFVPFFFTILKPASDLISKLVFIGIFVLYNLFFLIFYKNRNLGMRIMNITWKEKYKLKNKIFYLVLYTLSFTTILFSVFFPLDLLLFNLLILQLPLMWFKKTALLNFLSSMISVKEVP